MQKGSTLVIRAAEQWCYSELGGLPKSLACSPGVSTLSWKWWQQHWRCLIWHQEKALAVKMHQHELHRGKAAETFSLAGWSLSLSLAVCLHCAVLARLVITQARKTMCWRATWWLSGMWQLLYITPVQCWHGAAKLNCSQIWADVWLPLLKGLRAALLWNLFSWHSLCLHSVTLKPANILVHFPCAQIKPQCS